MRARACPSRERGEARRRDASLVVMCKRGSLRHKSGTRPPDQARHTTRKAFTQTLCIYANVQQKTHARSNSTTLLSIVLGNQSEVGPWVLDRDWDERARAHDDRRSKQRVVFARFCLGK